MSRNRSNKERKAMFARINNPRYKKVTGYKKGKHGIVKTNRYILNRKPYDFEVNGTKSVIFAPSKEEAQRIHDRSLKQKRYEFDDVVVFARSEKEAKRKANTERKRRRKNTQTKRKPKYVLYGTANGMKKKFGTYDSEKEAGTAQGLHAMDLQDSGFEDHVEWKIVEKK